MTVKKKITVTIIPSILLLLFPATFYGQCVCCCNYLEKQVANQGGTAVCSLQPNGIEANIIITLNQKRTPHQWKLCKGGRPIVVKCENSSCKHTYASCQKDVAAIKNKLGYYPCTESNGLTPGQIIDFVSIQEPTTRGTTCTAQVTFPACGDGGPSCDYTNSVTWTMGNIKNLSCNFGH